MENAKTEFLKYPSESPPKGGKKKNQRGVYDLSLKHSFKRPTEMLTSCREKMPKTSKNNSVLLCSKLDLYTQHELPAFKNTLYTDKALLS